MTIGGKTLLFTILGVFMLTSSAFAHPGNTAADGCHYCRTNCDKWGEVWNERHCHGGGIPIPPTKKPTPAPTKVAMPTPSPTPTPSPRPTPEGEVLGTTDEPTSTPTQEPVSIPVTPPPSDDSSLGVIAITLVALATGGGAYALYRRKKIISKNLSSKEL